MHEPSLTLPTETASSWILRMAIMTLNLYRRGGNPPMFKFLHGLYTEFDATLDTFELTAISLHACITPLKWWIAHQMGNASFTLFLYSEVATLTLRNVFTA